MIADEIRAAASHKVKLFLWPSASEQSIHGWSPEQRVATVFAGSQTHGYDGLPAALRRALVSHWIAGAIQRRNAVRFSVKVSPGLDVWVKHSLTRGWDTNAVLRKTLGSAL